MVYGSWIWHRMNSKAGYRVLVGGTVLEEDADGYGMQSLLDELPVKPAAVLVGKPTNGNVYRGHRGRMEVRIEVQGVGCHGSTPEKGKNALYLAGRVLIALEKLSGALREDPFLGKATLAATALDVFPGKFNQVPEKVVICVDRRLTAGETDSSAIDEIKAALPYPEVAVSCFPYSNTAWTGKEIRLDKYFPSWVLPESHPLVGAALEAGRLAFGRDLLLGKWTVSTDGVGSMGRHGIPTVGYGPGERRAVDDMQNIVDLVDALKFYSTFCHTVRTVA
jgi:putative selenium metabolism hydrolase